MVLARPRRRGLSRRDCRGGTLPPTTCSSLVHDPAYIAAVRDAAPGTRSRSPSSGGQDNPVFERMHEASALVAGTVDAARAVRSAARPSMASTSQAGCTTRCPPRYLLRVYNDAAVATAWLLADGVRRVAYVDLDAHHGDGGGVLHRSPGAHDQPARERLHGLPRHWSSRRCGGEGAEGTAVNVALPPETGDPGWLRAFTPWRRCCALEPEILVSQLGLDSHRLTAGAAQLHHRRALVSPRGVARAGARAGRRPLGGGRRRRLRDRPGRPGRPTCWPRSPAGRSTANGHSAQLAPAGPGAYRSPGAARLTDGNDPVPGVGRRR